MKAGKRIVLALLLIALAGNVAAQSRKKKTTKKQKAKPVVVEKTPQERLFEEMLPATAQILIIDSVVADKHDFLKAIPLSSDAGRFTTFEECFGQKAETNPHVHVNSFGNRCYFASPDTMRKELCSAFRVGKGWSQPQPLNGIGDAFEEPDYPFMMSDGITLYFGAKNADGLGGYDIFNTLLDTESNRFYKPQNIGLPFNSTANDYLYAVSETDTLGWFVTDRNQPEDKVCIYTFVPTPSRRNYDASEMAAEQLERLAVVASIADTWTDERERTRAMQRLERLRKSIGRKERQTAFTFIVNDETAYRKIEDFKSPTNRQEIVELLQKKKRLENEEKRLEELRLKYHYANASQRRQLHGEITDMERRCRNLEREIHEQEKAIRNTENILLNKS